MKRQRGKRVKRPLTCYLVINGHRHAGLVAEYLRLFERFSGDEPGGSGKPVAPRARSDRPAEPAYRIRAKQSGVPRSRILQVTAPSEDDARALALEEPGAGWGLLEVVPA